MKPGLYVHATRFDRAKELFAGPVYIDDTLGLNEWYVVTPALDGATKIDDTKAAPGFQFPPRDQEGVMRQQCCFQRHPEGGRVERGN